MNSTKLLTAGPIEAQKVGMHCNGYLKTLYGEGLLGKEGKARRLVKSFGAIALVPFRDQELDTLPDVEDELLQAPGLEYKPPIEVVKEWVRVLGQYTTEAHAIIGRNKEGDWLGVVPTQECTSASVDIEDNGPAVQVLRERGYTRVGTIHTHPGNMTQCSSTDTEESWKDCGGVHLVAGSHNVQAYFSAGGITFVLEAEEWKYPRMWEKPQTSDKSAFLLDEKGGYDYDDYILEKAPKVWKPLEYKRPWLWEDEYTLKKAKWYEGEEAGIDWDEARKELQYTWTGGEPKGKLITEKGSQPRIVEEPYEDWDTDYLSDYSEGEETLTELAEEVDLGTGRQNVSRSVNELRIAALGVLSELEDLPEMYEPSMELSLFIEELIEKIG